MKTKAMYSCVVTVQLIRAFDFAYAKNRFSHDTAQMWKERCYLRVIPIKDTY